MNKKAQFFLVAALIISGIILGLSQTFTSSNVEPTETLAYDLSNEVYYEASQVIDNGVFNSKPEEDIKKQLSNLTEYYSKINPDSDISIVYGNPDNADSLNEISYDYKSRSAVSSKIPLTDTDSRFLDLNNEKKKVRVKLNSKDKESNIVRDFEVKKGQNLYLVVKKKIKNEQFVISR
jgi:hypothetical protein